MRERLEDLPELVQRLLARINKNMHRRVNRVASDVMQIFAAYHWPGNIRELDNVLLKAVAMCPGDTITVDLIPDTVRRNSDDNGRTHSTFMRSLQDVERDQVQCVLNATQWHRGRACEILGISRPRLRRLIKQYHLESPSDALGSDAERAE